MIIWLVHLFFPLQVTHQVPTLRGIATALLPKPASGFRWAHLQLQQTEPWPEVTKKAWQDIDFNALASPFNSLHPPVGELPKDLFHDPYPFSWNGLKSHQEKATSFKNAHQEKATSSKTPCQIRRGNLRHPSKPVCHFGLCPPPLMPPRSEPKPVF